MKIKLDENIPHSVRRRIGSAALDIDSVLDEGLAGRRDDEVWTAAQAAGRFLVTQDLDFSDSRKFAPGTHHGVLIVRLPDGEQWRIGDYVTAWLSNPDLATWAGCLVIATPTKVRVIRPPT